MPKLPSKTLRVADLPTRKATHFEYVANENERAELAAELAVLAIKKLKFVGKISASGGNDWHLDADLGATVIQRCVVTLDPVTTRIDESVQRIYVPEMEISEGAEVEMPDDDNIDEIPEEIDLIAVMIESLSLALPPFPRRDGATLGEAVFSDIGVAPMTDEDAKPFAGLGDLRNALEKKAKGSE